MTYDINLNSQSEHLLTLISNMLNEETDFYKKALLKRIELNVKATNHLVKSTFLLDSCALVRISVDHCCRLFQYVHEPESITAGKNKTAFQILGHGPGTGYTFKALGVKGDFGLLYSVLCAFVHPDLMGLILALTEDDKNDILLKVVTSMGLIISTYILLEIHPNDDSVIKEGLLKEAESVMSVFMSAIISNATPENILGMKQIPYLNVLFANELINNHVQEFLNVVGNRPEKIEELLKHSL